MAANYPRPYWGWAIKGMGGVVNMMQSLADEECLPDDDQRVELIGLNRQLARLIMRMGPKDAAENDLHT